MRIIPECRHKFGIIGSLPKVSLLEYLEESKDTESDT